MTGRELVMALVGAGIVGGGAGFAASLATAERPQPAEAASTAEILERVKAIENQLAQAKTASEESRRALNEVQERVTKAEMQAAKQAQAQSAAAAAAPPRSVRVGRHAAAADGKPIELSFDGADAGALGGQIVEGLGPELDKIAVNLGDVNEQLDAFRNGLKLRSLPEADRWQKAKDDLGLTWDQVEDLKKAVADRDAAMKDAMTKETKTRPDGGTITIQRPDAAKAAHAEADYHDRVNAALDERQRKDWSAKGYDHAFGSGPFGGGNVVMAIDARVEPSQPAAPKDPSK